MELDFKRLGQLIPFRICRSGLTAWITCQIIMAFFVCGVPAVLAQDIDWDDEPPSNWGFRFSGRAMFNLELNVTETPIPIGAGYYDNGFVLPDVSGSGSTWNWGYENSGQVGPNPNVPADTIFFSRFDNIPNVGTFSESQAVSLGGELVATYELFLTSVKDFPIKGGVELGYGYQPVSIDYSASGSGTVTYTESYTTLNGVVPPGAPYAGTFNGPGPIISLSPTTQNTFMANGFSSYSGEFSGDFHIIKIGLYGDLDINEKWTIGMSGGVSSIYADTKYEFNKTTTFDNPSVPGQSETGGIGARKWLPGLYHQIRLQYNVNEHVGIFIGGELEIHKDLKFQSGNRQFLMEMKPLYGGNLGVNWKF